MIQFDKAIEINPNNEYSYNNKGCALSNLDEYNKAIIYYDKAIEINPNYFEAYNYKG